ncbi:D-alanyl-D-alanine carboxypeptidase [Salirhabdus euzebyi]|uniref:D-alanyl-D-alanine carboxypeptidase n=1 Tax=Salirhabdus euzebyi TaxID=394506 RepID=A0A841QAH5_9BACI|nr:D-alanyl-D-alanine carboxypeptidase family protein [Salirhabdus euzebyi]MBB6455375.1 D-alanyl-D-alanine carboxypeptidase [Salirhabdus euzebyi]
MKSKNTYILLLFCIILSSVFVLTKKETGKFDIGAESAILVDATTGKILFAKNAEKKLPPASMTKMMTEYLVLEAIENGQISWETTTQISEYAYTISSNPNFAGVQLNKEKLYTVRELYEAMAIHSDNGTTITLAELIAGTEGEFVKKMNAKAKEIGLTEYKFVNATGLSNRDLGENYPDGTAPDADNILSARSAALLAKKLIQDFPQALEIASIGQDELDSVQVSNSNLMLEEQSSEYDYLKYEGVDGLKTGWTAEAGYCFTGTAMQNGHRLISVVMKTSSKDSRFTETRKLFDYGFRKL